MIAFIGSHDARTQIEGVAKSSSGVNNINTGEIQSLGVSICCVPEQQEIVRLLDEQFTVIEQNEREIDTALKRSEALRQSILKKAFSGQLVAQDPADLEGGRAGLTQALPSAPSPLRGTSRIAFVQNHSVPRGCCRARPLFRLNGRCAWNGDEKMKSSLRQEKVKWARRGGHALPGLGAERDRSGNGLRRDARSHYQRRRLRWY